MSYGNLATSIPYATWGKMSSYAYMKNRQTRVSLAMCVGDVVINLLC